MTWSPGANNPPLNSFSGTNLGLVLMVAVYDFVVTGSAFTCRSSSGEIENRRCIPFDVAYAATLGFW
jgi:hypothetical protein